VNAILQYPRPAVRMLLPVHPVRAIATVLPVLPSTACVAGVGVYASACSAGAGEPVIALGASSPFAAGRDEPANRQRQ
jgi:hypothetical protein